MTDLTPERLAEIEALPRLLEARAPFGGPYSLDRTAARAIRDLLAELRRKPDYVYEDEYWERTYVVLTRDEHGDADEIEVRWFDTREEAEAAVKGEG